MELGDSQAFFVPGDSSTVEDNLFKRGSMTQTLLREWCTLTVEYDMTSNTKRDWNTVLNRSSG
jgi:hypothetical protein